MIRWTLNKEHPLKTGGKFFPLAKHDGRLFGRRQLPGEEGWHAHSYPENTEEVLDIPIEDVVWYCNVGIDLIHNKYVILTSPTPTKRHADDDRRAYADRPGGAQYKFLKQIVFSAGQQIEDPNVWNAAVNAVINLLRVNNDLTEDRQDLIESLLREQQ